MKSKLIMFEEKELEEFFKNINILDIINEVKPSKYFFNSELKPDIKYNKVKDENYTLNLKKYIELDYKNHRNKVEEINLFEKSWLNNKKKYKEFILFEQNVNYLIIVLKMIKIIIYYNDYLGNSKELK